MSIRFERRPGGGERLGIIAGITVGSFLAGLGVALVAAIVALNTHQCAPDLSDDECGTFLVGLGVFLITLSVTPVAAMPLLAWLTRMGTVFTIAATVAMALVGLGTYGLYLGWAPLLYPLGIAVLVTAALLTNRQPAPPTNHEPALSPATPTTARSTRKWVIAVAVAVVVVSAIPLGWELNQVRSEQQGIEAVIREPLQTDLDGTWPYSVDYSSTGIEYAVLEPPKQNGDRIANVNVTVRRIDTEPCTGFADVTESALSECAALGADVWQARDKDGKTHYFVHADEQWAHVAGPTYGGEPQQQASDARALQVAQTLRPRSAWPLAAASAECQFCEWFG